MDMKSFRTSMAEECSRLFQKTVDRFEVARALGCWNVGVYLLRRPGGIDSAGSSAVEERVNKRRKRAHFEPIRIHELDDV